MKRTAIALILTVLLMFSGCGRNYTVMYGRSEIYTKQDRRTAAEAIIKDFENWDVDCSMRLLQYAGDGEVTQNNLDYVNTVSGAGSYDQCIVFRGVFRTPEDSGAFEPNEVYYGYTWYLARTEGGAWTVVACGYP